VRLVALFRRNAGILSEVSAIAAADCRLVVTGRVAASTHFPLQLLEGTPGGTIARRARFHRIAGLIFRRTTFADRQACGDFFGAVVSSVNAQK